MIHETELIRVWIVASVVCVSNLAAGETLLFDNQADFETYALSQGGVLTAVETFEEQDIPSDGLVFLDDPLRWNVPNVDPDTGWGFPNGLATQNLLIQANMGPNPGAPTPNPRGTEGLFVDGAEFGHPRQDTGAAFFADSLDLIFSDPSQVGVGFWFSSVGFPPWPRTTSLEFTVFDQSGVEVARETAEDVTVADGGFFGVCSCTSPTTSSGSRCRCSPPQHPAPAAISCSSPH